MLVHDHAGNLTDDGVLLYTYDAWNRLVAARRRVDAQTPVAAYEYDGLNRRIRKQVDNSGVGVVPGSDAGGIDGIQAGNLNEHYYYAGWRVIEERDNSANTLAQTVYGTEYIDAPVCRDRNTDVTAGGSPDDDCLDSGGSARYFYHQDANFRVVAMTDESAAVVERYDYDAYGEPRVYAGVSGSAESGALRMASAIGNPYMHQGLRWDNETGLHENRMRSLHSRLGRFMQRDPAGYVDGLNSYVLTGSGPITSVDPEGLCSKDQLARLKKYMEHKDNQWISLNALNNRALKRYQDAVGEVERQIGFAREEYDSAISALRDLGANGVTPEDVLEWAKTTLGAIPKSVGWLVARSWAQKILHEKLRGALLIGCEWLTPVGWGFAGGHLIYMGSKMWIWSSVNSDLSTWHFAVNYWYDASVAAKAEIDYWIQQKNKLKAPKAINQNSLRYAADEPSKGGISYLIMRCKAEMAGGDMEHSEFVETRFMEIRKQTDEYYIEMQQYYNNYEP